MRKLTLTALLAAVIAGTAAAAAADAVTTNEWRTLVAAEDGAPITIISGSDTELGVILSCEEGKLGTGLGLAAGDLADMAAKSTNRFKRRDGALQIGDKAPVKERWAYMPTRKIARARSAITAKRVYNAAVTGTPITLDLDRKAPVTYALPEMNDTFKAFAKSCSVTSG